MSLQGQRPISLPPVSPPRPSSLLSQRNPRQTNNNNNRNAATNNTFNTTAVGQNGHGSSNNGFDNNNLQIMHGNNTGIAANQQMERVTFHLFSRLCNFGLNHTSYQTRKIVEHLLLVVAICCACALLMLHRTFVVTLAPSSAAATIALPTTCLDRLEGFDPASADLTHLVILPRNLTIGTTGLATEHASHGKTSATTNTGIEIESRSVVLWNRGTGKSSPATPSPATTTTTTTQPLAESSAATCHGGGDASSGTCDSTSDYQNEHYFREWLDRRLETNTLPIEYSYSTTKAYLMLPHEHSWLKRDMDVQYVLLSPTDPVCFGEPFVQFLLWNCYVGGNTVLLNWLLTFPAREIAIQRLPDRDEKDGDLDVSPRGYVYNPRTQWLKEVGGELRSGSDFSSSRWNKFLSKLGVFLRTSFLFFFCTTLVSFTLRETQERMLDFTQELSRRFRYSLSVSDLITTHLVQNLFFVPIMLGMMFFLIEFYNGDKFLAFSIFSIVWSVEGFSLVCLRSSQGLSYFPYFFFLLFLLFHVYQTAFPEYGFVYMALTVVWCFVLHSMVFFWHRYELPALVLGAVSIHRPRMIPGGASATAAAEPSRRLYSNARRLDEEFSSVDNHPAAPQLTETPSTSPATPPADGVTARNSSSSLMGAGGGSSGFLASHQSFQSTSTASRRTWGLYQPNLEDDNSTGSHLYFMGGEVVVRQQRRTPANHTNSSQGNTSGNHNSSGSDWSPAVLRRTSSFGPTAGPQEGDDAAAAASRPPFSMVVRNESNYSLLSTTSDAYGGSGLQNVSNGGSTFSTYPQHTTNPIGGGGGSSSNNNTSANTNTMHNNSAIGLDVSEPWSGDPEDDPGSNDVNPSFCDTLPNDKSMETVHVSNVATPPKQTNLQGGKANGTAIDNDADAASSGTNNTSDGYYAQEVGGLQAIFETKLTPRHRNSQGAVVATAEMQRPPPNLPQPPSSVGTQYQRMPPTFPELSPPKEANGIN